MAANSGFVETDNPNREIVAEIVQKNAQDKGNSLIEAQPIANSKYHSII